MVAEAGCDDGQGYLLAKPMPGAQFESLLHDDFICQGQEFCKKVHLFQK